MLKIFQFQEDTEASLFGDNHLCKVCFLYHALCFLFDGKDCLSLIHPTQFF